MFECQVKTFLQYTLVHAFIHLSVLRCVMCDIVLLTISLCDVMSCSAIKTLDSYSMLTLRMKMNHACTLAGLAFDLFALTLTCTPQAQLVRQVDRIGRNIFHWLRHF